MPARAGRACRALQRGERGIETAAMTPEVEVALRRADVIVVSYGITSRIAQRAIDMARARGLKVGAWTVNDAAAMKRLIDAGGVLTGTRELAARDWQSSIDS